MFARPLGLECKIIIHVVLGENAGGNIQEVELRGRAQSRASMILNYMETARPVITVCSRTIMIYMYFTWCLLKLELEETPRPACLSLHIIPNLASLCSYSRC